MSATCSGGGLFILWMKEQVDPTPGEAESLRLIEQAHQGDLEAFDRLMRLHERRVFRTATLLLGRPEDADDAVQETFLRLYRAMGSFDASRAFEPWLYRIAVNVCRDLSRRRRWKQWLSLDGWLAAGGSEPATRSHGASREAEIQAALARLSVRERDPVVLRDIEGLSAAEAARALGVSEGTVRSHASRGRAHLRKLLGGSE